VCKSYVFLGVGYDLDVVNDQFWRESMNTPFPYVAENMEKQVQDWQKQYK